VIFVDSNVLIASVIPGHQHHAASRAFISTTADADLAVTSASLTEVYNNLTRPPPRYGVPPEVAHRIVDDIGNRLRVHQLSAGAMIDTLGRFARAGGFGPRVYDYLIGSTAEAFGGTTLATWNVRDFAGLFPRLRIATPAELAA